MLNSAGCTYFYLLLLHNIYVNYKYVGKIFFAQKCVLVPVLTFLGLFCPPFARADEPDAPAHLTQTLAQKLAPPGLDVGAPPKNGRAFPLIRAGRVEGYIFDTLDYAPIPGFSGTPINLVVALDDQGVILDVHLVDQGEPVFQHGLGVGPFVDFLAQYRGKNIKSNISVGSLYGDRDARAADGVKLDGVAKASASVRIANVTILASAIAVARAHLSSAAPPTGARIRPDLVETLDWEQLLARGYVKAIDLGNRAVEKAFADSVAADFDPQARRDPDGRLAEIYFALADIPTVGINLFGQQEYDRLMNYVDPGDHVVVVLASGRWSPLGDHFVRGGQPDAILIDQGGFSIGGRDLPMDFALAAKIPRPREMTLLRLPGSLGFDPASPWSLSVAVERRHGQIFPITDVRRLGATIAYPEKFFVASGALDHASLLSTALAAFREQAPKIFALGALLTVLTAVLCFQRRATRRPGVFRVFRLGFLAVVLVWLGWTAQAQLSVVTLLGLIRILFHGGDPGFLLFDPVSLLLWIFVLATLAIWGRGSFCGWLCPFGALQEFCALFSRWLGTRLGWRMRKFKGATARRALSIKYGVLAALALGAAQNSALADALAEAEPFKTAITLHFVREPVSVAYALGLLAWSMVYYKPYCRFICPLGAGLALGGRMRRWRWIARRKACGAPCRLCERRCDYEAISRTGEIDYNECFQCLDCVAIYHDRALCPPLVIADRRARKKSDQPADRENFLGAAR